MDPDFSMDPVSHDVITGLRSTVSLQSVFSDTHTSEQDQSTLLVPRWGHAGTDLRPLNSHLWVPTLLCWLSHPVDVLSKLRLCSFLFILTFKPLSVLVFYLSFSIYCFSIYFSAETCPRVFPRWSCWKWFMINKELIKTASTILPGILARYINLINLWFLIWMWPWEMTTPANSQSNCSVVSKETITYTDCQGSVRHDCNNNPFPTFSFHKM